MTADQFRRLALALPDTVESSHMKHPDFRTGKKIFASLGYPNAEYGMIKLTPAEQAEVIRAAPDVFSAAAGAWGSSGSTIVRLSSAKVTQLRPILRQAYDRVRQSR